MPAYLSLLEFAGLIIVVDYWESNFLILEKKLFNYINLQLYLRHLDEDRIIHTVVAGRKWDGREIRKLITYREENFLKSLCSFSLCY